MMAEGAIPNTIANPGKESAGLPNARMNANRFNMIEAQIANRLIALISIDFNSIIKVRL